MDENKDDVVNDGIIQGNASETFPPSVAETTRPPVLHSVFIGPDGLRAGWRFAIYLALVIGLLFGISLATRQLLHVEPHKTPPLWLFLVGEIESLVAAVIPAL